MKCAIIGGSILPLSVSSEIIYNLDTFASFCAKNNIQIFTGGCSGYPFMLGKKCVEYGVNVIGFSAAKNEREHVENFKHPVDGCSSLLFLNSGEESLNIRFLMRSLPLIEKSDVVISIEGNWGTLFELITGVICGKEIIVWQGFGGISDEFKNIYKNLSKNCQYNYGERVKYARTVEDVIMILDTLNKV